MQRLFVRTLCLVLIAFVLFSLNPVSPVDAQTGPYLIANGAVNVHAGPGFGFWILSTLYNTEAVPILGVSPDGLWWYISARSGEGWVSKMPVTAYNTSTVAVRDPGIIGTVTSGALNVRFGAGINAASLGQLGQGQQVYVLSQNADGSWLEIRWAYGTGWVSAGMLATTGQAAISDDGSAAIPLSADTPYVVVLATYLNVRSGPGPNYSVLGAVLGGISLPIVGRSADSSWYQVETIYGTGWVYAGYVATRNEYGASPVTTSSAADAPVTGPIGVVNAGSLNIRSGPGAQYSSLGALAGGTETQIVGRTLDWTWWLLDTPVGTGWANAMYIIPRGDISNVPHVAPGTTVEASPGQAEAEAPVPTVTGPMAFVSTGAINIRSGPNSSFTSLGSVSGGTRMAIVGQSADRGWWLVESPFGRGWVSKLYVLVEGNTSGVPVQ
ncbi:MAG: SH3 domain-containing protein [Chloroflexi bacterium]|nr:SH3 domain-containing protein [Chloroflexota bacterium]